jgi:hypothetical protein
MSLASTLVLYLMLGAGIAGALLVREGLQSAAGAMRLASACLFWPMFVPVLLAPQPGAEPETSASAIAAQAKADPIQAEIARVESELEGALRTLDGWAEGTLALEDARFEELGHAWRVQAQRIRELGELLIASGDEPSPMDSSAPSVRARRDNIERLKQLHQRMQNDLLENLAWVRELVTLIHLAKYTGAPASRAEELVAQIAAAVEGLSEVSDWRTSDEPLATSSS